MARPSITIYSNYQLPDTYVSKANPTVTDLTSNSWGQLNLQLTLVNGSAQLVTGKTVKLNYAFSDTSMAAATAAATLTPTVAKIVLNTTANATTILVSPQAPIAGDYLYTWLNIDDAIVGSVVCKLEAIEAVTNIMPVPADPIVTTNNGTGIFYDIVGRYVSSEVSDDAGATWTEIDFPAEGSHTLNDDITVVVGNTYIVRSKTLWGTYSESIDMSPVGPPVGLAAPIISDNVGTQATLTMPTLPAYAVTYEDPQVNIDDGGWVACATAGITIDPTPGSVNVVSCPSQESHTYQIRLRATNIYGTTTGTELATFSLVGGS